MAYEEVAARMEARSCRIKLEGGKLVEGKAVIDDERVVSVTLWGEFFADPALEEMLREFRGLKRNEACLKIGDVLDRVFVAPRRDVEECLRRLLCL